MRPIVNGTEHDVNVEPDTPLPWVLRDELGLTGTKFGCGIAQCGACTVHVDGRPRRSCVTPVSTVRGRVTTIEGVGTPEAPALANAVSRLLGRRFRRLPPGREVRFA